MSWTRSFIIARHRHIGLRHTELGLLLGMMGLLLFSIKGCWAEEGFFNSNGTRIHYVQAGSGEAVVLIHGWMASSRMWGTEQKDNSIFWSLSKNFHVIAVDCRGHGLSDKPHDPQAYGCEMALDVVRLLDHLHIQQAHLIGYSMGAILVGKLVACYPKRVLSAIFAGGAPVIHWSPKDLQQNDAFVEKWQKDKGLQMVSTLLFGPQDRTALAIANHSLRQITVTASELRRYQRPVLFIYGERDWTSTKQYVEAAHQAFGRGDIAIIHDADHFTTPMKPDFLAKILSFLKQADAPSPIFQK